VDLEGPYKVQNFADCRINNRYGFPQRIIEAALTGWQRNKAFQL